ncbi:MAG: LysM peptidoglycan-binding domain-containing protein [Chloroflexi bacterium]|nr:LysM peptidoglycan-binding domain-containing protein [Chloroflexota bacterium]
MVFPRTFCLASFVIFLSLITGCIDDSPGPATAVPLQPTVIRPALATPIAAATLVPARSPSPSAAPAGRTYVVKDGDALTTIAAQVYGDASQWRFVFEANRDQLSSEDQLQVGQTLRIPPLPTVAPTRTT